MFGRPGGRPRLALGARNTGKPDTYANLMKDKKEMERALSRSMMKIGVAEDDGGETEGPESGLGSDDNVKGTAAAGANGSASGKGTESDNKTSSEPNMPVKAFKSDLMGNLNSSESGPGTSSTSKSKSFIRSIPGIKLATKLVSSFFQPVVSSIRSSEDKYKISSSGAGADPNRDGIIPSEVGTHADPSPGVMTKHNTLTVAPNHMPPSGS